MRQQGKKRLRQASSFTASHMGWFCGVSLENLLILCWLKLASQFHPGISPLFFGGAGSDVVETMMSSEIRGGAGSVRFFWLAPMVPMCASGGQFYPRDFGHF
jgi:hypothetical protein